MSPDVPGRDRWHDGSDALTFVEAPLPHDVAAVRLGGVEYVSRVVHDELPDGVAAIRVRGTAMIHREK